MFTGIIEATASILEKKDSGLVIERPKVFDDLTIGSSIAVSGVCLTVTNLDDRSMQFDVVPTTFQKSKLGGLKKGDKVNLERAMKADGRFEGHIVQGHCEGVGRVVAALAPDLSPVRALSPNPSPVPGEGDDAKNSTHVWKGVEGLTYPPLSVVQHARSMRKQPTEAEEFLWQRLRRRGVGGHYFRRQRPIGSFIVDFYCENLKLAIEVDGGIHHQSDQKMLDQWRTEYLNHRGVRLIRFTNDQVLHHFSDVITAMEKYTGVPLPPKGGGARGGGTDGGGGTGAGEISSLGEGSRVGARGEESTLLSISFPDSLLPFIIPNGSITIDGVALTVASIEKNQLTIAMIPHTLEHTTLGSLKKKDPVNIETDILGRYILQIRG